MGATSLQRGETALLSGCQQSHGARWLGRAAWDSDKGTVVTCYWWWRTENSCLAKTSGWWCSSSVGGRVSHRVFPSGSHWLASELLSCLCMELSASTELGTSFLLLPLHRLLAAVGCSLCDDNFHVLTCGFSVFTCGSNLHRLSPYKGKVKGKRFLEHLLSRLYYRESQGCPLWTTTTFQSMADESLRSYSLRSCFSKIS